MKLENQFLGRCKDCVFWKSFEDLVNERLEGGTSPTQADLARKSAREELSPTHLDVPSAEGRGWCLAAEDGAARPATLYAVHMVEHIPIRLITSGQHGCLNFKPRPSHALEWDIPDFTRDENLGRCAGCMMWSSATNEARALHAQEKYVNAAADYDDAEREAQALLSPKPLSPKTAYLRGWCKAASAFSPFPSVLSVDPLSGAIGGLITSGDQACKLYDPIMAPTRTTRPGWRMFVNRNIEHVLGPSASLNSLLLSYMAPGDLLDPNNPLSPLHDEHPLNPDNPNSLLYNPVPAFAAYVLNPSSVNTLSDPHVLEQSQRSGRLVEAKIDSNKMPISPEFIGDVDLINDPSVAIDEAGYHRRQQETLLRDFSRRKYENHDDFFGSITPSEQPIMKGVSLEKKRQKPQASTTEKQSAPNAQPSRRGFMDMRK